jgi:hypothetical protein
MHKSKFVVLALLLLGVIAGVLVATGVSQRSDLSHKRSPNSISLLQTCLLVRERGYLESHDDRG